MPDWIRDIRSKIGNDLLIVNSAGGWIENDKGELLLQKRSAVEEHWGFPGGNRFDHHGCGTAWGIYKIFSYM